MHTLDDEIRQLEASVEMLRIFVQNKRAKPEELEKVETQLRKLKGEEKATQVAERPAPITAAAAVVGAVLPASPSFVETVFQRKGELMGQIKQLTAEQNEMSNRLQEIDPAVHCGVLTGNIVSLRRRIEKLWTEYRFIERNGQLPTPSQISSVNGGNDVADDPDKDVKLLRISQELKSLRDRRLKLEKKLEKPLLNTKFPEVKVPEWQLELTHVREAIAELEYQKEQFS